MENKLTINEALDYLKDKAVITSGKDDTFTLINGFIHYKFNGSSISLSVTDFKKLFKDSSFYLVEDNSVLIDELKDKEYYEKYKK